MPTDQEGPAIEPADPGYQQYSEVRGLLEQAEKVVGEAGQPRAFIFLLDVEAKGSTPQQRVVEVYVLGNMPAEMLESALPTAIRRYIEEQEDARNRAG